MSSVETMAIVECRAHPISTSSAAALLTSGGHDLLPQDFRPDAVLCGTPSFALHIGESLRAAGGRPDMLGMRYDGMFDAKPTTEGVRVERRSSRLTVRGGGRAPDRRRAHELHYASQLVVDRRTTLARVEAHVSASGGGWCRRRRPLAEGTAVRGVGPHPVTGVVGWRP